MRILRDVVVTLDVTAIPPAAFDAFGTGQQLERPVMPRPPALRFERPRRTEQPQRPENGEKAEKGTVYLMEVRRRPCTGIVIK